MQRLITIISLCLCVLTSQIWAYSGGTGEPQDPYQIATAEDLIALGNEPNDYNDCFVLTADIDLSGYIFDGAVIALGDYIDYTFVGTAFCGLFDGKGHIISNLSTRGTYFLGVFGECSSDAIICNLGIEEVDVNGECRYISGLVGRNYGTIINCYSTGFINGDHAVGGLVGYNSGIVMSSYSRSSVSGSDKNVGGLVGYNAGSITSSYSTGLVSGNGTFLGGLVGRNWYGSISSSFWDTETSGMTESDGGMALISSQMQETQTYIDAGWDLISETAHGTGNFWVVQEGAYPSLAVFSGYSPMEPNGTGTLNDPYLLKDANDLGMVWIRPWASYRLEADIDLNNIVWNSAVVPGFGGLFDGNDHVISNLCIDGGGHLGLFGMCASGATISNLGLESVDVDGEGYKCGGLVARNYGTISLSYSTGSVSGTDYMVGGLVGFNNGTITSSYSMSAVSGTYYVGGLVGDNALGSSIRLSYSTGSVTGDSHVGGFVGANYGTSWRCFWDTETSGQSTSPGGTGLSSSQMLDINTFLDTGWDFVNESVNGSNDIWFMPTGNSPGFTWSQNRYITIPNVVGLSTQEAKQELLDLGLSVEITYQLRNTLPDGYVISQDVVPGSEYLPGTKATLVVSMVLNGSGTEDDPYHIATAQELIAIGNDPCTYDKHFVLTADIDLDPNLPGGKVFDQAVIAPAFNSIAMQGWPIECESFSGSFDGQGHVIRHLNILGTSYLGLFGKCSSGAAISNLGLEGVNINGTGYAHYIGGLVGWNDGNIIKSCYSTGSISGADYIGGLMGWNEGDIISSCRSIGSVSGADAVGGFVGATKGRIMSSYSTVSVSGRGHWVGGFVGANIGIIKSSYSAGPVDGEGIYIGGFVGDNDKGSITSCFWDTETSGMVYSDGGIGLVTAEMQNISTFLDAGWDFVNEIANGTDNTWTMLDSGYPGLNCLQGHIATVPDVVGMMLQQAHDLLVNQGFSVSISYQTSDIIPHGQVLSQNSEPGSNVMFGSTIFLVLSLEINGTGEPNDPYQIDSGQKLIELSNDPCNYDKSFVLTADIDFSGYSFDHALIAPASLETIGRNDVIVGLPFSGIFNGQGHVISHLSIKGEHCLGLFGRLAEGAMVSNLDLEAVDVNGTGSYIGTLAAENSGSIINCQSEGSISGNSYVGGLVGYNQSTGTISSCHTAGTIIGSYYTNSIAGRNDGNLIDWTTTATVDGDSGSGGGRGGGGR